jgi:ubiquinone/menaquinone biosynthesis C-methylase UbiE
MEQWNPQDYDAWYETTLGKISDRLEKDLIFSLAGVKKEEKALDVGCGTGIYSVELAKRGVVTSGIDGSLGMLGYAKAKARKVGLTVSFSQADALALPFPDDFFDLVVSINMLCFVKEPDRSISEMRRVVRPGGRIVIGALNRWSPWAALRRIKGLFKESIYREARFFSPLEAEGMLCRAGFETVNVRTCLFFLPVNCPIYLKLALSFERLDSILTPRLGAFLCASARKPY